MFWHSRELSWFGFGKMFTREEDGTRAVQRQAALLWRPSLACTSLLWEKQKEKGTLAQGTTGEVGRGYS